MLLPSRITLAPYSALGVSGLNDSDTSICVHEVLAQPLVAGYQYSGGSWFWRVIDLGPEGGAGGGRLIAVGTPEQVAATPESHTGQYLRQVLPEARPVLKRARGGRRG